MVLSNQLSKREQEVVDLVLEGKSNKFIAAALRIKERTVEFHLTNIYNKLQVTSRTELVSKLRESTVANQGNDAHNRASFTHRNGLQSVRETITRFGKELAMEYELNNRDRSEQDKITFSTAIRICLTKYAEFQGRASRPEFWWFTLFVVLVASALTQVHEIAGEIFLVAVLLPFLAAGARRLRDSGQSAWWLLFLLVPIGGIITLGILWAKPPADSLPSHGDPA